MISSFLSDDLMLDLPICAPPYGLFAVYISSERSFSCIFSIPEKMSETGIAERWDFTLFCEDFRAFGNMCYTHKNGVFDRNGDVLKWMSN